jgi:hypothetical protein
MHRPAAAALVLLLAATTACTSTGTSPAPPRSPVEFIVIDADPYGAIVADLRRAEFTGVTRDGTVEWRSPQATAAPDASACAGHCPDALLSGNAASQNAETIADPPPVLIRAGRRQPVGAGALAGRLKRTVLVADHEGGYVVTAGGPGRWTLDAVHPGAAPVRTPVPGPAAAWAQTADRRHGLAVVATADPARSAAVWFTHTAGGWRADPGGAIPVAGSAACLAPDGDRAMLLGGPPLVRTRDGHTRPVTDLDYVSDCGFAATGGILGTYGQDNAGITARIRVFGPDGSVTRRVDTRAAVRVTADPASARVAYTGAGKTVEVDPGTGSVLRTIDDTYGARYDTAGDLVVLDREGNARWLTTPR